MKADLENFAESLNPGTPPRLRKAVTDTVALLAGTTETSRSYIGAGPIPELVVLILASREHCPLLWRPVQLVKQNGSAKAVKRGRIRISSGSAKNRQ
jgi:hypothetical protein